MNKLRAFTLTELLVVIAIISLLSSVVMASLTGSRASARDARRAQHIEQMQAAIELYIHQKGHPPFPSDTGWKSSHKATWQDLETELQAYINGDLPVDPINEWPLTYYYRTDTYSQCSDYDGSSYLLVFATETTDFNIEKYGNQGEGDSEHRYCVYP